MMFRKLYNVIRKWVIVVDSEFSILYCVAIFEMIRDVFSFAFSWWSDRGTPKVNGKNY